jgi:FixJ family two-component response regulator
MGKSGKIVAVVDDDPSMLRAAEDLLEAHGFVTKCFLSAEEFLRDISTEHADCLLLDIHLGGLSGIQLRQQLKSLRPALPIIFMTAFDDKELREQALRIGCIAYLHKPFLAHQLMGAIEKACST